MFYGIPLLASRPYFYLLLAAHFFFKLTHDFRYIFTFSAIFRLLFESRIGCLQDPMPPESQGFINAVDRMFQSGQIMFLTSPEFFRKYKLKPWRDHEKAWDYIFNFGKFRIYYRKHAMPKG